MPGKCILARCDNPVNGDIVCSHHRNFFTGRGRAKAGRPPVCLYCGELLRGRDRYRGAHLQCALDDGLSLDEANWVHRTDVWLSICCQIDKCAVVSSQIPLFGP